MSDEKMVTIPKDAYERLFKFSKLFDFPMKHVLAWFIYALIDENGLPQIDSFSEVLVEVLKDYRPDRYDKIMKK